MKISLSQRTVGRVKSLFHSLFASTCRLIRVGWLLQKYSCLTVIECLIEFENILKICQLVYTDLVVTDVYTVNNE